MKKRGAIETNADLVRAFGDLFDYIGLETDEEIDTTLRDANLSPDEIGAKMKAAAKQALADSPLAKEKERIEE